MTLIRLAAQQFVEGHLTLCEPGECRRCDPGWEALRADARCSDNLKHAWELRHRVHRYVSGHPGCTLRDLYRELQCHDTPLYLCLHLLVLDFQLSGPHPYACSVPNDHEASTYQVLHLPGPPSE